VHILVFFLYILIVSSTNFGCDQRAVAINVPTPDNTVNDLRYRIGQLVTRNLENESRIATLEKKIPAYLRAYDENAAILQNSQHALAQNSTIIDSLINYQTSVNQLLPFIKKIIITNNEILDSFEISQFIKVCDTIIEANDNCKKKSYGD
jgi:hypothetical protein